MVTGKHTSIKNTDKSTNIQVDVPVGLALDQMETILIQAGDELGLSVSHITTLSRKKYPGNRHWHFKEDLKSKGCLDITYWPDGKMFWITIRNYEPDWVHKAGRDLVHVLRERFVKTG